MYDSFLILIGLYDLGLLHDICNVEKYIFKKFSILKNITINSLNCKNVLQSNGKKLAIFHGKKNYLEKNIHKHCIFSKIESMCNTIFQNIETEPSFLDTN